MTVPLLPRIRRAPLPDDAVIVVRGDDLDPATAQRQASQFRRRYPDWERWGLSAYSLAALTRSTTWLPTSLNGSPSCSCIASLR